MAESKDPNDVIINVAPPSSPQGGISKMLIAVAGILFVALIAIVGFSIRQQQNQRSLAQVVETPIPSIPPKPTIVGSPNPSCTPITTNLNPKIECPTCVGALYEPVP